MDYLEDYVQEYNEVCTDFVKLPELEEDKIPSEIKGAITFLNENYGFPYADDLLQTNPFVQLSESPNQEENKTDETTSVKLKDSLLNVINLTKNNFLKAKMYDQLGIVCGNK